jgi:methyltransferase (TIGR00027 family)
MEEERPSSTAEGAAIMRALHQDSDDEPKILVDPIASRLIEPDRYKAMKTVLEQMPPALLARVRAMFALRSRYTEDCLAESFNIGVRQYVILGAGLDTLAYRQPPLFEGLEVFEVDYPSTQQWKRGRLKAAGISVPGNVRLVAVDFEKVSLRDGLSGAQFDFTTPAVFSLLGVSQYLIEDVLDVTLKLVLSMPVSSEIIFSFVLPEEDLPADEVPIAAMSAASAAAGGEPWLTRFHPGRLEAKLTAMGFSKVVHLSPEGANQRYFRSRRDGLRTFVTEQMMRAIV